MSQLAAAIDADDELLTLDVLPLSPYVQIDDELIEIRARFPGGIYAPTQEDMAPKIRVRRGQAGTTKASHAEDATLTPVYGFGAGGGGAGTLAEVLAEGRDTGGIPGVGAGESVFVSVEAGGEIANVSATATHSGAQAAVANRTATSATGDAHADTTATAGSIEDASAKSTATTATGNADVTRRAEVTDADGGDAFADTQVSNVTGAAQAKTTATAIGDGDATADILAEVSGDGLATSGVGSLAGINFAGLVTEADTTSARMGFNGATPVAKPTGVAVTAEAIHAALVDLGLIAGP